MAAQVEEELKTVIDMPTRFVSRRTGVLFPLKKKKEEEEKELTQEDTQQAET